MFVLPRKCCKVLWVSRLALLPWGAPPSYTPPHWPTFTCSDKVSSTFSPQGLCTGCSFCLVFLPLPPQLRFSDHTSHSLDLFTGLKEAPLSSEVTFPSHSTLSVSSKLIRFVIPPVFVLISGCSVLSRQGPWP
jgi:hypothetical protein